MFFSSLFNCLIMTFFLSLIVKLKSFFSITQTVGAYSYLSNTQDSSLDWMAVCWQNFQHFILRIFLDKFRIENPQLLWILHTSNILEYITCFLSGTPTWFLLLLNFVHGCTPTTIGKWFNLQSLGHSFLRLLQHWDISSGAEVTERRVLSQSMLRR